METEGHEAGRTIGPKTPPGEACPTDPISGTRDWDRQSRRDSIKQA